jgi:hypothetical protein
VCRRIIRSWSSRGRFVGQQDFDGQPAGIGVAVLAEVAEADLD